MQETFQKRKFQILIQEDTFQLEITPLLKAYYKQIVRDKRCGAKHDRREEKI